VTLLYIVLIVAVGLTFDFTNGFHDSANAVAAPIATKAISPRLAVLGAAVLNVAGALVSLQVAKTIGKGIIDPGAITLDSILAGLFGAVCWNFTSWRFGLPTSSSQALIGGLIGAALAHSGHDIVNWNGLLDKVIEPGVISPFVGLALAAILVLLFGFRLGRWLDARPSLLRPFQILAGGFVAFAHGANDAQKTMGVLTLSLLSAGYLSTFDVPIWVILSSATAMAIGTYSGGWRIIATLGNKLTKLTMRKGTVSQFATAAVLYFTAREGYPISTTQVVTGSIIGSDADHLWRHTRWSTAGRIAIAWLITMPAAGAVGALFDLVHRVPSGEVVTLVLILLAALLFFLERKRIFAGWHVAESRGPRVEEPAPQPAGA
jgi:inorganic phosphate transporter, PiT family